jgi:hypothetical protein
VTVRILYLMLIRLPAWLAGWLAGWPLLLLGRSAASKDANQRTGVDGAGISGLAVLFMVRRRSTVRFRNGAPVQRNNSKASNRSWEPFREPIGPSSSQGQAKAKLLVGLSRLTEVGPGLAQPGPTRLDVSLNLVP